MFLRTAEDICSDNTHIDQIKDIYAKISPVEEGDIVAVKIHPGEYGNTTYIRPVIIRTVVDLIREQGGVPFVTDTTVLYRGRRFNAVDLLWTASANGFSEASMNAPFIVADGLTGNDSVVVEINGEFLRHTTVASAIANADSMVVISHCKGHPGSGFGGAIKNLGMGCLDKAGKTKIHEVGIPSIDYNKCSSCGICIDECAWGAFTIEDNVVTLDCEVCKGELSCVDCCPSKAIIPPADCSERMQIRLGEAAAGPVKVLEERIGYINWAYDITPFCDCCNFSSPVIAENVGILASKDPVAIDSATVDLINNKIRVDNTSLADLWATDPKLHILQAEKIGIGSADYLLDKNLSCKDR
ncbi:4Fe-4S ferredoxin iron-sulfur binding domain protein [Methanosalsum zhilinae DSM 4017]|uniref:4Fe-4S ferredoxin iron-sulfur binding domain protein n=1 Tax=Methanosalsum zhilinae (strain DSM 4017 / NBRC 107636 / OCM 62 / WeN5) TaxID=679901 RepID=F7XM97_METZD|nr:DUF362 domain-containing protein [Methanosalsum zhilinae]AEH60987.1 4Fe-4S ferredoxin iron-sulfur binding domain protein [Methanosalsum zhilinae DSM 4017]